MKAPNSTPQHPWGKAPNSKLQEPEKFQTSNTNPTRTLVWSLVLDASLELGCWSLELFPTRLEPMQKE